MTDEIVAKMEAAVEACNAAREELELAIESADEQGETEEESLRSVAAAIEDWRDGQRQFMDAVSESEAPDVSTAAMLLKTNHGIDSANARRGLPGVHVDGANQPFDLDMTGTRGTVLTTAVMEYVTPAER